MMNPKLKEALSLFAHALLVGAVQAASAIAAAELQKKATTSTGWKQVAFTAGAGALSNAPSALIPPSGG